MDHELSRDEIEELLPAYAIDAVDDVERVAIDEYLARTPDARDEVSQFRVAASLLAHTGGAPPEGVWERLESIIADDTSRTLRAVPAPDVARLSRPASRTIGRKAWRSLAAVAAAVALVFGGLWLFDRHEGGGVTDVAALARTAMGSPGARRVALTDSSGRTLATAVLLHDGTGYLESSLPALPRGRTYQLWSIGATQAVSLGVLGTRPTVVAFKSARPTLRLAVTDEIAGGVQVSHHAPTAVGDVRA